MESLATNLLESQKRKALTSWWLRCPLLAWFLPWLSSWLSTWFARRDRAESPRASTESKSEGDLCFAVLIITFQKPDSIQWRIRRHTWEGDIQDQSSLSPRLADSGWQPVQGNALPLVRWPCQPLRHACPSDSHKGQPNCNARRPSWTEDFVCGHWRLNDDNSLIIATSLVKRVHHIIN